MRVLVCPLDWGLGHATRCVPLIRALLRAGHAVVIGATGGGLRLLREEFPDLESFDFPGYPVRYSSGAATLLPVLLLQLPRILRGMARERSDLAAVLAARGIDRVVSDGRYGVRSRRVPCVFVTHQLFIRIPGRVPGVAFAERVLRSLNERFLRGFAEVWVPDFPGAPNLSGELSHKAASLPSVRFIGPLSRFHPIDKSWPASSNTTTIATSTSTSTAVAAPVPTMPKVDIIASVSGPEPQRTRFEAALRKELAGMGGTRVLVRGLPGAASPGPDGTRIAEGNLNVFDHLEGGLLGRLFATANLVVARSGYTTVMELAGLGVARAVFVPTPGQSEQEYLAAHLEKAGIAAWMDQDSLDLGEARRGMDRYRGFAGLGAEGEPPAALADFIAGHPLFRSDAR